MLNVKAVSFDFWNTLATPSKEYAKVRTDYLEQLGITKGDYTKVKSHLDYYAEVDGLAVTPEIAIGMLMIQHGYRHDVNLIKTDLYELFKENPPTIHDDVRLAINLLEQNGIPWGVTSNTNFISGKVLGEFLEYSLDSIDMCQVQTYSDLCGYSKPSKRIFLETYNGFLNRQVTGNMSRKDVLHIGDNGVTDYAGALDFGFSSKLIASPNDVYRDVAGALYG